MPCIMCGYCQKLSSQHNDLEAAWEEILAHERTEHAEEYAEDHTP
jgi:hypothetical protein